MDELFRFPEAVRRDPAVETWMLDHPGELGALARCWFDVIRACGDDVFELLHDGAPTVCVTDVAFANVDALKADANVGFFRGAELTDPHRLLLGSGKFMRHVKLRPDETLDAAALTAFIQTAYVDIKRRLATDPGGENR